MRKKTKKIRQSSESRSIKAVTPDPNTAQIDIDSRSDLRLYRRNLYILRARTRLYSQAGVEMPRFYHSQIKRSKGGHWHAFLKCDRPLLKIERIALQSVLGSDRDRELLSLCRYFAGSRYPTLFYELMKVPYIKEAG